MESAALYALTAHSAVRGVSSHESAAPAAPCITLVPEAAPGRGQLQAIILSGQYIQESHEDQLQQCCRVDRHWTPAGQKGHGLREEGHDRPIDEQDWENGDQPLVGHPHRSVVGVLPRDLFAMAEPHYGGCGGWRPPPPWQSPPSNSSVFLLHFV